MLHNFFWHSCWTWRERSTGITWRDTAQRLVQFQLTNGAVAMAANLLSMRVLVGEVGLHYFPASVLVAAAGGIVNFLAAEFVIFRPQVFETAAPLVRGRS